MNSIKTILIIFTGSGIGGAARWGMQKWMSSLFPSSFPAGTFAVNIAGCFLIGVFYALGETKNVFTPEWRLALITGFCGGFTTFSAFGYENMNLLRTGDYFNFGIYTSLSVALGIAAVFAGAVVIKGL